MSRGAYQMSNDELPYEHVARASLEAAAPHMLIHVHHHDIEHHARSFNEGYEAAVTQGLADDPSLADDWFQEKIREAKAAAWEECEAASYEIRLEPTRNAWEPVKDNPYKSQP